MITGINTVNLPDSDTNSYQLFAQQLVIVKGNKRIRHRWIIMDIYIDRLSGSVYFIPRKYPFKRPPKTQKRNEKEYVYNRSYPQSSVIFIIYF